MLADDELRYFSENRARLETHYLRSGDARQQSGFGRSEADWARYRSAIIAPVKRSGTFLDIGCANGLLMECVARWGDDAGFRLEPYGIDVSDKLVRLAKHRLPHWKNRIFAANALLWEPPTSFDFVRTELVYVPPPRRREYVERLLNHFLLSGGKLLVCSYGSSRPEGIRTEDLVREFCDWGITIESLHETLCPQNRFVVTRVVCIASRENPLIGSA